jgi:hypothetical protein
MEQVENIQWAAGLHTSKDASLIDINEIADMSNAVLRDGTIKLDQRYIKLAEVQVGSMTPQGSGWGKYGSGTLSNQYVLVNDQKLYEYDLTSGTPSLVQAATGLATGDWFWAQFADYLYGVNNTGGLGRKKLATGSNGHGDWATITLPTAPANAPTVTVNNSAYTQESFANSTFTSALGGALSHAYNSAPDNWRATYTSAQTGSQSFTITFSTVPDRRPDWGSHDHITFTMLLPAGVNYPELTVISTSNPSGTNAVPWRCDLTGPPGTTYYNVSYNINNISRTNRAQITALTFTFVIPSNGANILVYSPRAAGVWLTLNESATVPFGSYPSLSPLQYEYTYYNSTLALESAPSPQTLIPASSQNPYGEWRTITCATTAASGVDKIRIYRRVEAGGAITRYRLTEVANSGTPQYVDKLALDEVKALSTFTPAAIPTSATAVCAWLNRLALGSGSNVYVSRDNDPLSFTPTNTVYDPADSARAITFPVDDRHAETVLGLAASNCLYIITDYSVRYLFGTTPDNWRMQRVPDIEGACGARAWCPYQSGVLVLTPSGRLMHAQMGSYYSLASSLGDEPTEISLKLRARKGNQGIKDFATSDAVVSARPDGQIEIRNSTGYLVLDISGNWRKGTYATNMHSALYISGLPLRWVGTDGKLYQGGDDSYVTDGGTTGTNGSAVTAYVTTRNYSIPRSRISNVFLDCTQSLDGSNNVLYPKVTAICARTTSEGLTSYKPDYGKKNFRVGINCVGEEMQYKIEVDATASVTQMRVTYEQESPSRQL